MTFVPRRATNLAALLRQVAARLPDAIAVARGERTWTWAQVDARVDALALTLRDLGLQPGERVLVQSRNCVQLFESMFACFRAGVVWTPANFRQTPDELAAVAEMVDARALIHQAGFEAHARACLARASSLAHVVVIGDAVAPALSYEAEVARRLGAYCPAAGVERDDPCWFFLTSGSTGRPKAAVLTHGQMAFVVNNHLADLMPGLSAAEDASLAIAPLSHGAGIHQLVQAARGVKTVLLEGERLDPAEVWALVERWRVTNMFTVPTIVKALVEHPAADLHDHSSLRHVVYAGAPMYGVDQARAVQKLGKVMVQYYGLGEVTGAITVLPPALHTGAPEPGVGTCGYARTGMTLSIQDAQGRELAPGEAGEICVCGPAVFAGYHDNPAANSAAFRDGWFRTGDLGRLDDRGFLAITGRASDMYISGGSNVYPREIEEMLLAWPGVAEAAVVGVPDAKWGEVGVAICTLQPGATLDPPALLAWLGERLARYKLPRDIHVWEELPKSAYGKVTKAALTRTLLERTASRT